MRRWLMVCAWLLAVGCDSEPTAVGTGDEGRDARAAVREVAVETVTSSVPDTGDCHTDCFGGAVCTDGVVTRLGYGPKPCEYGPGCETGETYTCATGCREFGAGDALPSPSPMTALSAYCAGE